MKNNISVFMSDPTREAIIDVLSSCTKNHKSAVNYEKRLWKNFEHANSDVTYFDYVYEIIAHIKACDTAENRKQVILDLESGKSGWDMSAYDGLREKRNKGLNPTIILEDSEFQCRNPRCRSKKCYTESYQTRSMDEGMTPFVICSVCSKRYKLR